MFSVGKGITPARAVSQRFLPTPLQAFPEHVSVILREFLFWVCFRVLRGTTIVGLSYHHENQDSLSPFT